MKVTINSKIFIVTQGKIKFLKNKLEFKKWYYRHLNDKINHDK